MSTHTKKFVSHEGVYLLSHSVGRPLDNAADYLNQHYFQHWEKEGDGVWPKWQAEIEKFRLALASLLNGNAKDICPQTNLSSALTKVIHSLTQHTNKKTIVYTEQDFPSMGFVLTMAQRSGFTLRCIPSSEDVLKMETWDQYITDDCAIALITHVQSNTGANVAVDKICRLARGKNVVTIVDIAQSVGVVPIDVVEWNADFVVGSCVKWLCGGPGAGFLWVNEEVIEHCEPLDVGWFSHSDPFEFNIHHFAYADDALRFWGGTPSVAPYIVATNSIDLISSIGVNSIREHNLHLQQKIIDQIDDDYLVNPIHASDRGGTLILDFKDRQTDVEQALLKAKVLFDSRVNGMRFSPHIYNTEDELNVLIDCCLGIRS